jgi:hypothetical protein
MSDLKISQLPVLVGSSLQSTDPLALADLSASETKQMTAAEFATGIAGMFPATSIPFSSINGTLAAGSVDTTELADGAVTAPKLADDSSWVVAASAPVAGEFLGQGFLNTTDAKAYIWNGNQWLPFLAGGSVNSVAGDLSGLIQTSTNPSTGDAIVSAAFSNTTQAAQFAAGPTGQGGAVTYRTIAGADLPTADASNKGGVIVSGDGLRMTGQTIQVDNDITAATVPSLCTVDSKGLVTAASLITPLDLPLATSSTIGAVMPGVDLGVSAAGVLDLNTILGSPGTYTKVTCNSKGLVTTGALLTSSDIPDLPGEKITSGSISPDRITDHTLEMKKLADYAVSYIQENPPSVTSGDLAIGCYWFQPSIGQLRIYDGNYFAPVGFGRLSQENLRWGGTVDASTGLVTGLTEIGVTAGLSIGSAVPTASDALGGLYLLIDVAGSGILVTPSVSYVVGEWCLCVNATEGWIKIDTQGGGGGGGASLLSDLLDVTLTSPNNNQGLIYNSGTSMWVNADVVNSWNTRTGAVMPAAGDYTFNQIGDVSLTTPQTGDVLVFDGTNWTNEAEIDGGTY